MKKLSIVAVSAMLMGIPAFAETTHYSISPITNQTTTLKTIFSDTENLQVAILSEEEMAETQGAVIRHDVGGFGRGGGTGFGFKVSKKLSNLNSRIGQKLGEPKTSVGQPISAKGFLMNTAGGGTLGAAAYKHSTPKAKQTTAGFATAVATGAVGGSITTLPIGTVRSYVIGTSFGMGGQHTATKHMIKK